MPSSLNIQLICIDKIKEEYIKRGIYKYLERIEHATSIEIIDIKPPKDINKETPEIAKAKEAREILKRLEKCYSFIITLDERGKELNSIKFAQLIENIELVAIQRISFPGFEEKQQGHTVKPWRAFGFQAVP